MYRLLTIFCFSSLLLIFSQKSTAEQPNVVLIVIDTLRADHLPFYGYKRNTAPFLTSIAEKSTLFNFAFSTSSWTAPATASIHTGEYPWMHGIRMGKHAFGRLIKARPETKVNKISEETVTLAEKLKEAKYKTFGISDNSNICLERGFTQGFDYFETFGNQGSDVVDEKINEWESEIKKSEPYFLYIQFMEPHQPYTKRQPWYTEFSSKKARNEHKKIAAYDSEIALIDSYIEKIFKKFKWDKNTIFIVTSDHGDEFLDHSGLGHGKTLYGEVTNVPLFIFRSNSPKKEVIESPVSLIDIYPTVLDLLQIQTDKSFVGQSLLKTVKDRNLFSEVWKKLPSEEVIEIDAIVTSEKIKLIRKKTKKSKKAKNNYVYLYDLKLDPKEQTLIDDSIRKEKLLNTIMSSKRK